MQTTNHTGMADASVVRRPPARGRWRGTYPATAAVAGALLGLTLLAAGCSSGPASASGTGQSLSQADQEMVSFARCMRSHGVQMSDPYHRPGHSGLTLDLPTRDSATGAAYAACNHLIQPINQAKQAGAAAVSVQRLTALTRYAECMRGHDINMLDPNTQGLLVLGNVPGMASNDFGRSSPQFHSADAACRHLLPPGVTDNGSGP
jgi:hypothetical protein